MKSLTNIGSVLLVAVVASAAVAAEAPNGIPADAMDRIMSHKQGDSRKDMTAVEEQVRGAVPGKLRAVEDQLVKALESPKATFECKQWSCRMLRQIGTEASVPALAKLLDDEKLSHMARYALQSMPGVKATAALREALGRLKGAQRIGVIDTLGRRGDRQAVADIAKLAGAADRATAAAAIKALGNRGGPEATKALSTAAETANKELNPLLADAWLRCAESLTAAGGPDAAAATAIYRKLAAAGNHTMVRIAGIRGLAMAEKEKAVPMLLALLKDPDVDLQRAAGKFLTDLPGSAATMALAQQLASLPPSTQVVVLGTLTARGDKAAAPAVAKRVDSPDPAVRAAAIDALGAMGDATSVELLARHTTDAGEAGGKARAALERLGGVGVPAALVKMIGSDLPAAARERIIEVIITRRMAEATDGLFAAAAADKEADVRRAALKALGILGGQEDLPKLVGMLLAAKDDAQRRDLEQAVGSVVSRSADTDAAAELVMAALAKADAATKANLVGVLPRLGGAKALSAAREQLKSGPAEVKTAALRAMSDWPDAAPVADLLAAAKSDAGEADQVIALRGYVKLLSMPANRSSADTTKMLAVALAAAKRPAEKKTVLAALPKFPCSESLALAKSLSGDADLAGEASLAAGKIKAAMEKMTLTVTASQENDSARNALDDKPDTRWTTGRAMQPGDWFAIDLGREALVKKITLDSTQSPGDYPRGYEVCTSFDGQTWSKPVLTGKGDKPITELAFSPPVRARHIKIIQTGTVAGLNWSIHTLKIEME